MAEETFRPRKPGTPDTNLSQMAEGGVAPSREPTQAQIDKYERLGMKRPPTPEERLEADDGLARPTTHPLVAKALFKNRERLNQQRAQDEEPQSEGPRLAFTGNDKLDSLLAGIKEQVYQFEEILLPSLGRFYTGEEAPLNGKLHVRPMTGAEEEILATPRFIKKGQAINMIFRNCVKEAIKPELLLTPDRTMLLIYLRGISYGPDYEVEVRCPTSCNTKFSHKIDLDKEVTPCPADFGPDSLEDVLPNCGYRFTYRLANGRDDNLIADYREKRIRRQGESGHDDTFTFRASLLVQSISDPKTGIRIDDQGSIKALLSRLPIGDLSYIRNVINEPPFGLDTKCQVVCPNCSDEFEIELPMETSFFFPRKKRKGRPPASTLA